MSANETEGGSTGDETAGPNNGMHTDGDSDDAPWPPVIVGVVLTFNS